MAAGANLKTTAFDKLERSMAKVTAGTVNATKSFAALDKGLSSVGRSASAAGTAAGSFDRVARSATTAEVALLRYARAQKSANSAMSRAGASARPTLLPAPAPHPRRRPSGAAGTPPYRDRYGNLIEVGVGDRVAEGAATRAAEAGAELERQRVDATAAGLNEHEAAEVEATALDLSRKYRTVPQSALMRMMRNARAATGDLEDALAVMDPLTKLRVLAQAKHPGADVSEEFETLVKGMEIKGVAQDRAEFMKYMDGMAKAMNVFGEQVRPSAYYQMFKYGRGSTRGLSEDYMLSVAPTLAAELGGSSTGVAGQNFYQAIVGRRLKKSSLIELEGLGLLDQGKIERDKKGQPMRVGVGGVVGADLARADPYRWVNQVLLPAMAKKGITDPNAIGDHIAAIFGNSLAQQLVSILATQQQRIEKDRKNLGKAQGLDAADEYLARDPGQALSAFSAQLQNLLANASSPLMPAATAALNGLAGALGSLSQTAKEHPAAAGTGLLAGLGGLAAGSVWLTRKVLTRIGFGGTSVRAATAPVATEVAAGAGLGWLARIGTKALGLARLVRRAAGPTAVASLVAEGIVAGYEAADDRGRMHPYGAPGEGWRRRYEENRRANDKLNASRERANARRARRDGRLAEEYPDHGFHGAARPAFGAEGAAAWEAYPDRGFHFGAPSPLWGSSATPTHLEGVAAVGPVGQVNDSLDRAAEKITEALNGHAEVAIKIEPSPDLVARVVSMAKDATMKAINLTGPGSVGRTGGDIP
ncbi:hypothetical protein [Pinisolibacter aquiterrae]|uniref:hypothetical protein n=1 Tax=Pinisolibacter aquiterrae TaxID=2815579 RepID=UPI001E30F7F1|nr:hypothetical protein [Pinisolibacter aquiterrae]